MEVLVLWLLFSEVIQSETFLLIFVCLLWSIKVSFTDQLEPKKLICLNQYKVFETLKTSLSGLQLTYRIKLFCYNVHRRRKHNSNNQEEELWGEKSLQGGCNMKICMFLFNPRVTTKARYLKTRVISGNLSLKMFHENKTRKKNRLCAV